jgi:hypothetical protein
MPLAPLSQQGSAYFQSLVRKEFALADDSVAAEVNAFAKELLTQIELKKELEAKAKEFIGLTKTKAAAKAAGLNIKLVYLSINKKPQPLPKPSTQPHFLIVVEKNRVVYSAACYAC